MRRYVIARTANYDLEEIVDYLSDQSFESGEQFIQKFSRKCRYLVNFPKIGRPYDDLEPGLRGILLDRYIIFYQVTDEAVTIARVVRGDRDLTTLFRSAD
jgi:toxin ParE1/3/4